MSSVLGKIKRTVFRVFTLGLGHTFNDTPVSLRKKINIYFGLFPKEGARYSSEIQFLNLEADIKNDYSYILPYPFIRKYNLEDLKVFKDEILDMYFVLHLGKRLYYSKSYNSEAEVRQGYYSILLEQDNESPHKYTATNFDVNENDIVVDIGGAEGNFSLEVVEKAGKVFIFETEKSWIEALEATFKPWKHKVQIINKYVSKESAKNTVALDDFFSNSRVDFIKIDVEGAEKNILKGAKMILEKNKSMKLAICTYHKKKDALVLSKLLQSFNYNYEFTKGYMLFIYSYLTPPYFRKGLLRARKLFHN